MKFSFVYCMLVSFSTLEGSLVELLSTYDSNGLNCHSRIMVESFETDSVEVNKSHRSPFPTIWICVISVQELSSVCLQTSTILHHLFLEARSYASDVRA